MVASRWHPRFHVCLQFWSAISSAWEFGKRRDVITSLTRGANSSCRKAKLKRGQCLSSASFSRTVAANAKYRVDLAYLLCPGCRIAQQAAFQSLLSAHLLPAVLGVPVTFQGVPSVKDVPPQDLTRLQKCLSSCAVNTNNLVTAFDTNLTGFPHVAHSQISSRAHAVTPEWPAIIFGKTFVATLDIHRLYFWTSSGLVWTPASWCSALVCQTNSDLLHKVSTCLHHCATRAQNACV